MAVIVTVAWPAAAADTEALMPAGAEAAVVPAAVVYQETVPTVPAAALMPATEKVVDPAAPVVTVAAWAPRVIEEVDVEEAKLGVTVAFPERETDVEAPWELAKTAKLAGLAVQPVKVYPEFGVAVIATEDPAETPWAELGVMVPLERVPGVRVYVCVSAAVTA